MKLSVVVPIYNVERYINKCLESLRNNKLEIIAIVDGSTDESLSIVEKFSSANSINLTIVNQENRGLAEARNVGVEVSTGDFIWFVDGDDYVNNSEIDKILDAIDRNNFDVYTCGYNIVDSESEQIIKSINNTGILLETSMAIKRIENPVCNVWRYIVRKDFLVSNNIRFRKGTLCEDIEWGTKVLANANKVSILDIKLYNYRHKRMIDVFENIERSYKHIDINVKNKKKRKILRNVLFKQYIYNIYSLNFMVKVDRKQFFKLYSNSLIKVRLLGY